VKIANDTFVAIDYSLTLDSGEEADRSEAGKPLGFVFGSGMLIPGLEKQLLGMTVGDEAKLDVEIDDAYGQPDPKLIKPIAKENFPDDAVLQPGMVFSGQGPHGPVAIRIASVEDDHVMADFNHPLSGQRLHFAVKVVEVRAATEEDKQAATHEGCSEAECQGCGHQH
jgi:FKBP-type peptidyl-prolyl cis-trans isomerase SlyD